MHEVTLLDCRINTFIQLSGRNEILHHSQVFFSLCVITSHDCQILFYVLKDVGTSHLCDGLCEQSLGNGLNTLVLWNNQITYQSMPSLARSLVSSLHVLCIYCTYVLLLLTLKVA